MNGQYRQRELESTLKRAVAQFPAIVLTGPRQSGKTTLLRHLYSETHGYVTLDDPQVRQLAINDPKLFLEKYHPPIIIDEIQYAPSLLPYLKIAIDQQRQGKGLFLLTGSQQFPLMQGGTESLAGRTAVLTLLPMSWREILSDVEAEALTGQKLAAGWLRGSFPELVVNPDADNQLWYAGYLQTYLERDVRSLRQVGDLGEFQNFLQALAARNGQLLKLSEISRDLGIAVNTVKAWLRILEASQQIFLLRPYHRNLGKRLIKSPKLYFIDLGLLCYLSGLRDASHALQGPAAGALMETAIFGELLRNYSNQGKVPQLFFWRTSKGEEVDFIIETPEGLVAIEGKLTKTPQAPLAASLEKLSELFAADFKNGYLVCLTEQTIALTNKIEAVPFSWLIKQQF